MPLMKQSGRIVSLSLGLVGFILLASLAVVAPAPAHAQSVYVRLVRAIKTERLGVAHPVGLTFAPDTGAFLLLPDFGDAAPNRLVQFDQLADPRGTVDVAGVASDRANMSFDTRYSRLLLFDSAAGQLVAVPRDARGQLDRAGRRGFAAGLLGLQRLQGLATDPASGRLYLLDANGHRLIRVTPSAQGDLDAAAALRDGRVTRVNLPALGPGRVRGLAFDPRSQHLFVLNPRSQVLYELTESGQVVATRDLAAADIALVDPQSMVIAPSGDQTDDPAATSLYLADSRLGDTYQRAGQVYELSLTAPTITAAAPVVQPTLARTIDTSTWANPSPDPMDITYLPGSNQLLVSDSEIEEYARPYWHGGNQFLASLTGSLAGLKTTFTSSPTSLTPSNFSDEPAGVAYNALNGHWFYSDDDAYKVFEIDLSDGIYGNSNDKVTSFATKPCGDYDPESIAVDTGRNHLILADGLNGEVYDIAPGSNGRFDGCASPGDDTSTHFDTTGMGILDPEGIEYNPDTGTLFITGHGATIIIETTVSGTLLKTYDISAFSAKNPSGLAYAPSSAGTAGKKNLYMSARGKDNDSTPNENDGKVYEIDLGGSSPAATSTPTRTSTPVTAATSTPTRTSTPVTAATSTPTSTPVTAATSTPTRTSTPTSTPSATDQIFADGFESGNLSAWTKSSTDSGDLSASAAAALRGSSGLQALIDDNNTIYVTDDTPNAEPRYRARFSFDPNSIAMADGDAHYIFSGYTSADLAVLRAEFGLSSGSYQLRLRVLDDGSTLASTSWFPISDAPHSVEIDWRASTAAGANNGGATLWIDGVQKVSQTTVDNDTRRIDRVKLGVVSGNDTGTRGTEYFDAFESRRQTYIGP